MSNRLTKTSNTTQNFKEMTDVDIIYMYIRYLQSYIIVYTIIHIITYD